VVLDLDLIGFLGGGYISTLLSFLALTRRNMHYFGGFERRGTKEEKLEAQIDHWRWGGWKLSNSIGFQN
jgi:hypothetical protein